MNHAWEASPSSRVVPTIALENDIVLSEEIFRSNGTSHKFQKTKICLNQLARQVALISWYGSLSWYGRAGDRKHATSVS
jgi:hypothetical protein